MVQHFCTAATIVALEATVYGYLFGKYPFLQHPNANQFDLSIKRTTTDFYFVQKQKFKSLFW